MFWRSQAVRSHAAGVRISAAGCCGGSCGDLGRLWTVADGYFVMGHALTGQGRDKRQNTGYLPFARVNIRLAAVRMGENEGLSRYASVFVMTLERSALVSVLHTLKDVPFAGRNWPIDLDLPPKHTIVPFLSVYSRLEMGGTQFHPLSLLQDITANVV